MICLATLFIPLRNWPSYYKWRTKNLDWSKIIGVIQNCKKYIFYKYRVPKKYFIYNNNMNWMALIIIFKLIHNKDVIWWIILKRLYWLIWYKKVKIMNEKNLHAMVINNFIKTYQILMSRLWSNSKLLLESSQPLKTLSLTLNIHVNRDIFIDLIVCDWIITNITVQLYGTTLVLFYKTVECEISTTVQ